MTSLSTSLPHVVLEIAAYAVAGRVYARASIGGPRPERADRWLLFASAIAGAALGAKLLHVAEHWPTLVQRNEPLLWLGGKSLLGGLLGGTLGVELGKRAVRWRVPTGDPWVPALAAGIVIGRIGCQLSGTWDQTYGSPTSLPWGWNYGDGVLRHPTALYELLAVAVLFAAVRTRWRDNPGARFAAFLAGYCVLRFALE